MSLCVSVRRMGCDKPRLFDKSDVMTLKDDNVSLWQDCAIARRMDFQNRRHTRTDCSTEAGGWEGITKRQYTASAVQQSLHVCLHYMHELRNDGPKIYYCKYIESMEPAVDFKISIWATRRWPQKFTTVNSNIRCFFMLLAVCLTVSVHTLEHLRFH